jgi:hypothetical protein
MDVRGAAESAKLFDLQKLLSDATAKALSTISRLSTAGLVSFFVLALSDVRVARHCAMHWCGRP